MKDKVLGMIGLCRRAGRISAGGDRCSESVKKRAARLVIMAADASENTKKNIRNSCAYYNIFHIEYADKEQLGKSIGMRECSALSVNDENFAEAILDRLGKSLRDKQKG